MSRGDPGPDIGSILIGVFSEATACTQSIASADAEGLPEVEKLRIVGAVQHNMSKVQKDIEVLVQTSWNRSLRGTKRTLTLQGPGVGSYPAKVLAAYRIIQVTRTSAINLRDSVDDQQLLFRIGKIRGGVVGHKRALQIVWEMTDLPNYEAAVASIGQAATTALEALETTLSQVVEAFTGRTAQEVVEDFRFEGFIRPNVGLTIAIAHEEIQVLRQMAVSLQSLLGTVEVHILEGVSPLEVTETGPQQPSIAHTIAGLANRVATCNEAITSAQGEDLSDVEKLRIVHEALNNLAAMQEQLDSTVQASWQWSDGPTQAGFGLKEPGLGGQKQKIIKIYTEIQATRKRAIALRNSVDQTQVLGEIRRIRTDLKAICVSVDTDTPSHQVEELTAAMAALVNRLSQAVERSTGRTVQEVVEGFGFDAAVPEDLSLLVAAAHEEIQIKIQIAADLLPETLGVVTTEGGNRGTIRDALAKLLAGKRKAEQWLHRPMRRGKGAKM